MSEGEAMTPYFSFEEELWAKRDGAELTMCRFERFRDEPVLRHGGPGAPDEHRIDSTNVVHNGDHFVMWYQAMRPPPQKAQDPHIWHMEDQQNICVAYSDDGIRWEKPNLRLSGTSWGDAPDNVLPVVSRDVYGAGVIHDGQRYVMMHVHPRGLKEAKPQTTFSIFTSDDGLKWEGDRTPCIDAEHFEPSCTFFKFKDRYRAIGQGVSPYYRMPDGRACGRVMFVYESTDLKTWKGGKRPAFAYPIPKHFPEAGLQVHCGVAPLDRGRIALGFLGQFWPAGFSELVTSTFGLTYSHDGRNWTEPFPAEPMIKPIAGTWECGMLLQGYGMYSRGETSLYWYAALDGGNLWSPRGSAGVVRIRRDGFAYLSANGHGVTALETTPMKLSRDDRTIYLNVMASKQSPVDVECRNARTGKKVGSASVKEEGVLVPALRLDPKVGAKEVVLRFKLRGRARLYSFYTGPELDTKKYLDQWV